MRDKNPSSQKVPLDSEQESPKLLSMSDIEASQRKFFEWMENHPCGHLRISPGMRLFNITGKVNSDTRPGTRVKMFITPNTSFNHSMHVIDHCAPLWQADVGREQNFSVTGIPVGKYILFLPVESFPAGHQGFPLPEEFSEAGYLLKVSFLGGDPKHSLSAFEIKEIPSSNSS